MSVDVDKMHQLTGLLPDAIAKLELDFAKRYHASLDVLLEVELQKSTHMTELRKQHSYKGSDPHFFLAAKLLVMKHIIAKDQKAFRGDFIDQESIDRVVAARIAKIELAEKEKRAPTLYKFLARNDIYSLVSNLRNQQISWENISLYLTKYHQKEFRMCVDNKSKKISKGHLSQTWAKVIRARNHAAKIERMNDE